MTFDSLEELIKIKENHSSPELILRISVSDPTAQCPLATKFGCDPLIEGPILIKKASQLNLKIIGISFHVGSGCRDPKAFNLAICACKKLFDIGILEGHSMNLLDIGGGFPGQDNEQITFFEIVKIIQNSLNEYFPASNNIEIIAEPGRYFASSLVSLCTNLISVTKVSAFRVTKRIKDLNKEGQMLYLNESVYGSFNCILFDHFQPLGKPLFQKEEKNDNFNLIPTIIWGQTCDGLDQIEENIKMPKMEIGDWLFYKNMGAYTSVAASKFNGFDIPKRNFYVFSQNFWNFIYNFEIENKKEEKNNNENDGEVINNEEFNNKNNEIIKNVCQEWKEILTFKNFICP